jgi:hypothetical protein
MRVGFLIIYIISIFSLSSCSIPKPNILGLWFSEGYRKKEYDLDYFNNLDDDTLDRFLFEFKEDHTFLQTRIDNEVSKGTYLSEKTKERRINLITLFYEDGTIIVAQNLVEGGDSYYLLFELPYKDKIMVFGKSETIDYRVKTNYLFSTPVPIGRNSGFPSYNGYIPTNTNFTTLTYGSFMDYGDDVLIGFETNDPSFNMYSDPSMAYKHLKWYLSFNGLGANYKAYLPHLKLLFYLQIEEDVVNLTYFRLHLKMFLEEENVIKIGLYLI